MKRTLAALLLIVPPLAAQYRDDWREQDRETINRTFRVAVGDNVSKLMVDQIHGFIHVTGGSGSEIQVTVEKHIWAETKAALDDAKRDVKLDMTQDGNSVSLYENGPFRGHYNGDWWDRHRYEVVFDSEIRVPAGVALELRTVNNSVVVKNTAGDFKVHSVNGRIEMEDLGGSGSADTVNGSLKLAWTRNPSHESSFHTVNGSIELHFHSVPDADLEFQTVHGGVFSDFDVITVPTTVSGKISGARYEYRNDGHMKVRAGKGGPTLNLRTVNGSIRLYSKGN